MNPDSMSINIIRQLDLKSIKKIKTKHPKAIYVVKIDENPKEFQKINTIVTAKYIENS